VKLQLVLLGLCAVGLGVGLGGLYLSNTKMAAELEQLHAQNQELQNAQASSEQSQTAQLKKADEELARLRKDNEELLRLRNELRQLQDEKQQLSKDVKSAKAQMQSAEAQTAQTRAQMEALRTNQAALITSQKAIDPNTGQPLTGEALRARYGQAGTSEQAQANACINNLRQIDAAKQQWAFENNRPANSAVSVADLSRFFSNRAFPSCPAGGTYTLNPVGVAPTCSIPGHAVGR